MINILDIILIGLNTSIWLIRIDKKQVKTNNNNIKWKN